MSKEPEDEIRCVVWVRPRGAGSTFMESERCKRRRGFGPKGLFCKQHAGVFKRGGPFWTVVVKEKYGLSSAEAGIKIKIEEE